MTRGGASGTPRDAPAVVPGSPHHGQAQYLQQPQSTVNADDYNDTIAIYSTIHTICIVHHPYHYHYSA